MRKRYHSHSFSVKSAISVLTVFILFLLSVTTVDAQFLKIDESKIQSPTYSYMHEYEETLLHIDMYRLETPEDMIQKWILEKIEEYKWICIEWPKFQEYYQDNEFLSIDIRKLENEKRELIY